MHPLKFLLALPLTALAACANAPADEPDAGPDNVTDAGEQPPAYLIHSAVQAGNERLNYFTVVDDLQAPRTLDYEASLELPGRPRLYAMKGVGFFAIADGESPVITRYDLVDGRLVAGDSLSLSQYGVTAMGAQAVHFVSPTKAYYKDSTQAQVVVWNPTEMAIEKVLALPTTLVKEGWATSIGAWAARDGEAFFAVGWSSRQYDRVHPGTVLVRIDTATDALTIAEESRCRDLNKTGRLGDTLYFFSGVINGLGHAVNGADDGGQQDCILRIQPGASMFDAAYVGTVSTALGEGKVGTIVAVDEDGEAWMQVADLSVTPNAVGTTYSQWYSAGWSWWHLPLATLADPVRVAGEAGAYSGFAAPAGGGFFVSRAAADYSLSTLVDLGAEAPTDGVAFPGFVLDVAALR